jgi:methylenetetrahydrofolate reductase (NADPH)
VIADEEVAAALRRKIALAADQGLALRIVSQFCFDGAAVLAWLQRLRGEGIAAPVRVGVAGPASLRTLINFGLRCGIGNSLRALGNHTQSLAKLLSQQGPEAVVAALAGQTDPLGAQGLHVFPFGGFPRSAQWLSAVREGRFTLTEDGFRLDG